MLNAGVAARSSGSRLWDSAEAVGSKDTVVISRGLFRGAPHLKSFHAPISEGDGIMLASQIMSQPVIVCRVSDSLHHAARLMWEHDCGVVPVVNEAGQVVAMLTDRDICMAALTQGRALSELPVSSAMSQRLYTCSPGDSLELIEHKMREHQVRRFAVVNSEGQPLGLVSLNDVARAAAHQHPRARRGQNGVSLASAGQTLAAVCAVRPGEQTASEPATQTATATAAPTATPAPTPTASEG